MPKRHPDEVKQQCGNCTRQRYELIQSPLPDDSRYVCNNCWNYLWKKKKAAAR